MARRFYDLPPLTTLAAFEAAARHLSLKNAAGELNVTPGAVSHQVKALEGDLGATLFVRRHRGVELTEEGSRLFSTLAESFVRISHRLREIRQRNRGTRVTIGATSAVASLWTARLLAGFWREHPDVTVDQLVSDDSFGTAPELDMFIRYGRDANTSWDHHALYRDVLVPLANPELAAELHDPSLETLAAQRLIYLDASDQSWTRWSDWFGALKCTAPQTQGLRVNNYMIGLYAAVDGLGVALGWRRLVDPLIRRGELVVVGRHSVPAPHRFYLVTRPDGELSDAARTLRDWLVEALGEPDSIVG
jgi:LysR family transcriptional regulator, glycine cleavage system transcriptional activator